MLRRIYSVDIYIRAVASVVVLLLSSSELHAQSSSHTAFRVLGTTTTLPATCTAPGTFTATADVYVLKSGGGSDGLYVCLATNTWTGPFITGSGVAAATNALKSATTTVNVSSATAPTTGQVLTATGASSATWQTPSSGGATTSLNNLMSVQINTDLVTGVGVPAKLTATAPAATVGSQAGTGVVITASDAVDGTTPGGAAAGGFISLLPGAAVHRSGNTWDGEVIVVGAANTTLGGNYVPELGFGTVSNTLAQLGFSPYNNGQGLVFGSQGQARLIFADGIFMSGGTQITIGSVTNDPSGAITRLSSCGTKCWQTGDPNDTANTQNYIFSGFDTTSGTDTAGGSLIIRGGFGTGAGAGGDLVERTSWPGATGTTAQTLFTDRSYFRALPKTLTENSATGFADINVPSGFVCGGTYSYTVEANDATDFQAQYGTVQWSAANKAGTVTVTDNTVAGTGTPVNLASCACSSGTLSETATETAGTNKFTVKLNAISSLTQTVLRAHWRVTIDGGPCTVSPL